MRGLVTDPNSHASQSLERIELRENSHGYDEDWLQDLMHANPSLIPLDDIAPGSGAYIPICRELTIPKPGGSIFLDLFGVTPTGKLVLIECKLWRNPQARREVVAQALEYAALMRAWSYADLTASLNAKLSTSAENPLYDLAKAHEATISEAAFVDQVTQSLRSGDFIVIIAGDGIRSDVQAMADHLNTSGTAAIFSLLEIQLWEGQDDKLTILPAIPFMTKVIKQRVIVDQEGVPLTLEPPQDDQLQADAKVDPERAASNQAARAFWQSFIDQVAFDHAEQTPPRHGGHNFVRMAMPEPLGQLTAYRTASGSAGFYCTLKDEGGEELFLDLEAVQDQMAQKLGSPISMQRVKDQPFEGTFELSYPGDTSDEDKMLKWLLETANKLTSSLRTLLAQYS